MGGMKRSYKVIRKGMIRDARWQTKLDQKPYNSKHIVFANKSLPVLIGHRWPKTKHCVSISRPPSIQSIPACVSLDQFVQYPNRTDWIGWSHLWVRMSFPMFQLIVTELRSACPISQPTQLWVAVLSPSPGCGSGVDLVARTRTMFQLIVTELRSVCQISKKLVVAPTLGCGLVSRSWVWERCGPGGEDSQEFEIFIFGSKCPPTTATTITAITTTIFFFNATTYKIDKNAEQGVAVLLGYVIYFICVSNHYGNSWRDLKREEGCD